MFIAELRLEKTNVFLSQCHQLWAARWLIGCVTHWKAEQWIGSQNNLSCQSLGVMLREHGPHLLALDVKFSLIHRKQTQNEENKQPLSSLNKDWRSSCLDFYISHNKWKHYMSASCQTKLGVWIASSAQTRMSWDDLMPVSSMHLSQQALHLPSINSA